MPPASYSGADYSWDKLFGGPASSLVKHPNVTILSGQVLLRGAVLGKITASSKYILSLSAAVDGSEVPDLILAEDCDATAGDKVGVAYEAGVFNSDAIILGTAHTIASVRAGLRDRGIHLVDAQG